MSIIPRRIQIDRLTPAENAIRLANEAVEALPADVRLTSAQVLLGKARDLVADYVDGIPPVAEPRSDTEVAQAERVVIEAAMMWLAAPSWQCDPWVGKLEEACAGLDEARQRSAAAKERG